MTLRSAAISIGFPLRDIITGFAVLLLLALTAALAGPYFIDWGQHRDEISRRMSAFVGLDLKVEGAIGVTLLPTPSLKLGQVRVAEGGVVAGDIGRIKISAAIPPLLRGQIKITEALVQGGRLTLNPAAVLPDVATVQADAPDVVVEKLSVSGLAITIRGDAGADIAQLRDVEGVMDATGLLGPFKGSFAFTAADARRQLRFSTGRIAGKAIRVRAMSENMQALARVEYDGSVSWAGGIPALDGKLSGSGNAAIALSEGLTNLIWRAEAQVRGTAARASADQIEIAVGHADRQALLSGAADVALTPGFTVSAVLAARQMDLDRLLAGEDNRKPPTPEALVRRLMTLAGEPSGGRLPPLSGALDVTVGSVILGGGVMAAPRVVLAFDQGQMRLARAEAELPGRARLSFAPTGVEGGPLSVDVREVPTLAAWYTGNAARPGLVRSLSVEGSFARTEAGFRISNGAIRADDMRFAGALEADLAGAVPKVTAVLDADQLDIARLPDFGTGDQAMFDLDLRLEARRVRYFGAGAGSIRAVLSRTGPELHIAELAVRDLGGASMRAEGQIGGAQARFAADVQGQQLDALLELLDKMLPQTLLPHLKARARALAPVNLSLAAVPAGSGLWRMTAKGKVGGTDVDAGLVLDEAGHLAGRDGLKLEVAAVSIGPLLRKIGLPAIDAPGAGPIRLTLAGAGPDTTGAPWSLKGHIGATLIDLSGLLKPEAEEVFAGRIVLDSPDISPLAQALLITVPQVLPGQSMRVAGGIDFRNYRLTIREMDAAFSGVPVKGEIAFNLLEFGRVSGQLTTPFVDAALIGPLVFGLPATPQDGWSAAEFAPPAAVTLPGDLWIEAGQVRLGDGLMLDHPKFVLRFDQGLIFLDHARARFRGAAMTGQGTMRRNGRAVSVTGRLAFEEARALAGATSGDVEFTGLGESPAQLISGLNGGGAARFQGLKLPALPPTVFQDLTAGRERTDILSRNALSARLAGAANGVLEAKAGEARLSLSGGVLRAGPLQLTDAENDISAGLAIDLRTRTAQGRMAYSARSAPKNWTGPAPQVVLTWRGLPGSPVIEAEADEFANGLTALAIHRETERIEALEQDQRERGFFNRRLRAADEERRAEAERRKQDELTRAQAERERINQLREETQRNAAPVLAPLTILPPAAR